MFSLVCAFQTKNIEVFNILHECDPSFFPKSCVFVVEANDMCSSGLICFSVLIIFKIMVEFAITQIQKRFILVQNEYFFSVIAKFLKNIK